MLTSTCILARVISKINPLLPRLFLLYGEHFAHESVRSADLGGIGGIAAGMAGKDVLEQFFSVLCSISDRPFSIGETGFVLLMKYRSGTVAEIGWRITRINTFDHARCTCLIPSFHPLALRIRDG